MRDIHTLEREPFRPPIVSPFIGVLFWKAERVLDSTICILGDVHGHLQLALSMAARWQVELNRQFEAVLLCGDVGTFTEDWQLDNATRNHAKTNPCELEFLLQWSVYPQPEWLGRIFQPIDEGGLGLTCPVVMVHGNHEGFAHLETLATGQFPRDPVSVEQLPIVDTQHHIRYLPCGWTWQTASGIKIAGIGGVQPGQRRARYHQMAFIDEAALIHLLQGDRADVLITHQGPTDAQGQNGSSLLQMLLDAELADFWFHGHSVPQFEMRKLGPKNKTLVVPLNDIAFPRKGNDPGLEGFSYVEFGESRGVVRDAPQCWRDFRKYKWIETPDQGLICPALV